MLDSIQGRGPGMAFTPYCSLPELEACMKVWEFMEMIHSPAHTLILSKTYIQTLRMFLILFSVMKELWNVPSVLRRHMMISLIRHINMIIRTMVTRTRASPLRKRGKV
jgi:hypothetical protein